MKFEIDLVGFAGRERWKGVRWIPVSWIPTDAENSEKEHAIVCSTSKDVILWFSQLAPRDQGKFAKKLLENAEGTTPLPTLVTAKTGTRKDPIVLLATINCVDDNGDEELGLMKIQTIITLSPVH